MYPNVKIQIEGKGSSTAPPALIAGTVQFGPMSRAMKNERDRPVRDEVRLQADADPHVAIDALAVYVNKDNPIEKLTLAQVDAIFSKTRAARRQGRRHDLGPARPDGRLGEPADQPLRPQLRLAAPTASSRSTRCATATTRTTVKEQPGLGLGRPGRDRGPLRHRLQRHRLQDLRRQGARRWRTRTATVLRRHLRQRDERQVPAGALPLRLRQQGARQAARPAGPGVRQADPQQGRTGSRGQGRLPAAARRHREARSWRSSSRHRVRDGAVWPAPSHCRRRRPDRMAAAEHRRPRADGRRARSDRAA